MRKILLALMSLACLSGPALAQQQPKTTADQGAAGAAPWPVTWTGSPAVSITGTVPISGKVGLLYSGSDVASGNPLPVSLTNNIGALLLAGTSIVGKVGTDLTTPGTTNAVAATGTDGSTQRQIQTTTTGALSPPIAAAGKITQTRVAVAAATSTQLVAANTARIAVEIQCDGLAPVGIDRTGAALTDPVAAPLVIPSGSYPLYTMPVATQTAITAYTAAAQSCRVTEYVR